VQPQGMDFVDACGFLDIGNDMDTLEEK